MEEKGFEKSRRDRAQHLGGKRPGQGGVRVERGRDNWGKMKSYG